MKIAILSTHYPSKERPNVYVFVHERAKAYQERGYEVKVFSGPKNNKKNKYLYEEIKITSLNKKKTMQEINNFNPDIVIDHAPNPLFSSWLHPKILKKYLLISWIHGFEVMKSKYYDEKWWQTKAKLFLNNRLMKKDTAYVAVSNWMMEETLRNMRFDKNKFEIIANAIDTELFKFQEKNFNKLKAISLRNFFPKYGIQLSIPAINKLDLDYLVCGFGSKEDYDKLKELIESKKIKIMNKKIRHGKIPELFKDYNVFIAPSLEEAQGISMMEAMACGMPVITTNIGGIPEFVTNNKDGIICEPNIESIREGIKKFISLSTKDKKNMSREARKKTEKYSKKNITNQEIKFIKKIYEESKK